MSTSLKDCLFGGFVVSLVLLGFACFMVLVFGLIFGITWKDSVCIITEISPAFINENEAGDVHIYWSVNVSVNSTGYAFDGEIKEVKRGYDSAIEKWGKYSLWREYPCYSWPNARPASVKWNANKKIWWPVIICVVGAFLVNLIVLLSLKVSDWLDCFSGSSSMRYENDKKRKKTKKEPKELHFSQDSSQASESESESQSKSQSGKADVEMESDSSDLPDDSFDLLGDEDKELNLSSDSSSFESPESSSSHKDETTRYCGGCGTPAKKEKDRYCRKCGDEI